MRILALDTATSACSVALGQDGRILARRFEMMERGQSEALMPMVQEVMGDAGFETLDLLAVTVGPGAFTGLRIGLAAARGMALAAGLPCLGVTTLEAVAHGVAESERDGSTLLVVLESKRSDVYAQAFSPRLEPLDAVAAAAPEDLDGLLPDGPVVLVGDGAGRADTALAGTGRRVVLSSAPGVPDAALVAAIAGQRWRPGLAPPLPVPLYLRPPDARPAAHGGRLRP